MKLEKVEFVNVKDAASKNGLMMFTKEQAPGALKNGPRVQKVGFNHDDAHEPGMLATVVGSMGPKQIDGRITYIYFVEWDDTPGIPAAIMSWRVKEAR